MVRERRRQGQHVPLQPAACIDLYAFLGLNGAGKTTTIRMLLGMIRPTEIAAGTADWPTYFGLLAQAVAVGGLILFGLIAIWLFGREFSDHTAKDLLALPVSRGAIVSAKYVVAACWSVLLALVVYGLGVGVGGA